MNEIEATMESGAQEKSVARGLIGQVASARMDKTASVVVLRTVKHPVYGKYTRRRTKLLAHDEANECHAGDTVRIVPCRPLSKRKAWRIAEIVERAAGEPEGAAETSAEEELGS